MPHSFLGREPNRRPDDPGTRTQKARDPDEPIRDQPAHQQQARGPGRRRQPAAPGPAGALRPAGGAHHRPGPAADPPAARGGLAAHARGGVTVRPPRSKGPQRWRGALRTLLRRHAGPATVNDRAEDIRHAGPATVKSRAESRTVLAKFGRRMLGVDAPSVGEGRGCGRVAGYLRRPAAESTHPGPADAGGPGRGGRAEPAVGQRPGAGRIHHTAQGHGPAAGRRAAADRPRPGRVRGGGAGPGGACRAGQRRGRRDVGRTCAAARHRLVYRAAAGTPGAGGRRGGRGRGGGHPRDRRDGRGRQDRVRGARRAPAGGPVPRRADLPAVARAHTRAAAGRS